MMEQAQIITHTEALPLGRRAIWHEWVGNPHATLKVHYEVLNIINHLPWKMVRLEDSDQDFVAGWTNWARADGWNWFSAAYWLLHTRVGSLLRQIYYRLIITAHVWGLAKREINQYPSYKDLRIWDWLDSIRGTLKTIYDKYP